MMKKKSFSHIIRAIRRRFYRYLLHLLGLYFYRSYWHFLWVGKKDEPNSSYFYLAAKPNPGAGIGHQMANWIAGYWYAKDWGLKFAHIPFSSSQWEDFLGFGIGEGKMTDIKKSGWKVRRVPIFHEKNQQEVNLVKDIISSYSGKKVIFLCEQDQFYKNQYGVMKEIQEKFIHAPARHKESLIYSKDNLNIAIHVRRGDILLDPNNPNLTMRYLSNDYFDKVLSQVVSHYSSISTKPVHIYFFSQGTPLDYPEFEKYSNLHWCMEMNAQESFLHMVKADILITSKSSFSYKPALLNREGIKICPKNFWHGYPNTSDWIMSENDGTINWD